MKANLIACNSFFITLLEIYTLEPPFSPFESFYKQLGSGAFGRVLKAQAYGIVSWEKSTTVAVKMVKPHADITYIRALMAELKIMISGNT